MDKQDLGKIDELLDEQMSKFPTGKQIHGAQKHVVIKLVSTDIEHLYINGVNTGHIVCGVATVDGIYYAAFFDPFTRKGYVEEVHLSKDHNSIKSTRLIQSPEEWSVITSFFNKINIFESRRILTWITSVKNNKVITNNSWLKKINKTLVDKNLKPFTKQDLYKSTNAIISNLQKNSKGI